MSALEAASVEQDIVPLASFIARCVALTHAAYGDLRAGHPKGWWLLC